jgi:hypothetical protein
VLRVILQGLQTILQVFLQVLQALQAAPRHMPLAHR